jgi:hypothetical protein
MFYRVFRMMIIGAPRVIRMMVVGDAATRSVILTSIESLFTIINV